MTTAHGNLDADPDRLCDALPDGLVIAGPDRRVLLANLMARQMLGEGRYLGEQLEDVIALQDTESNDWYRHNAPYDTIGIVSGIPEQVWLCPDGREVLVTARITRTAPSAPVRTVAVSLRSARGRARLDRERSDLVATVAHELRSPLTGVRGFVSTLLAKWELLNDDQKKLMLKTVNADSARLSRLITELLDVARIDTGRLPLYPREIDLAPVIERTLRSMAVSTTRPLIHVQAEHGHTVFADPDKLTQVLTNLVDNAIRHGEGAVRITTEGTAGGVRMLFDDDGEGIPEAIRARVFTKFWKHGASGGSGLGMYIVNGLVRVHGGELTITDSPTGGARIVVDWPSEDPRQPSAG